MSFLNSSALFFFFFFFFFLLFTASYICSVLGMSCSSTNYTRGSGYEDSLRELYSALANASLLSLYANSSSTSNATRQAAYGMFQCRGDVSQKECAVCVNTTLLTAMQQSCPSSMGAADQPMEHKCHVRYDYNPALFDGTSPDMGIWYYVWTPGQSTDAAYQNDVITALQSVTDSAPFNPNYYASTRKGLVYALAQCDGYLSTSQCRSCLSNVADVSKYLNQSGEGGIYYGSCFYTYDSKLFFEITSLSPSISPAAPPTLVAPSYSNFSKKPSSISIGVIVGGSVGGIVLLALFIWGLLFCCAKNKRRLATQGSLSNGTKPMFLDQVTYFSYEEIKAATLDFHPDNKIGSGGFGPVYKGTLANGLEVAIKKLSANSCQGNNEFMNEVSVIASVRHKNLIRLYGYCVEDPDERLLIYEYLPNKSLDDYLFTGADFEDRSDTRLLDWKTRLNIIVGTARGLAYLHHDSQIRIIHRDIKASNILLDEDLSPKIADFGLAKLLSHDGSHVTTKIAGTLGYLPLEYAFHGYLTEKVDVYSFGVVSLEILSGRKNRDIQQHPERGCLLNWARNCYEKGEQMQLLDPKLSSTSTNDMVCMEEVLRVIHMALLCLQPSPMARPSMRNVIQALVGQSQILEIPKMPQYTIVNPRGDANTGSRTESQPRLSETDHEFPSQVLEESDVTCQ